jgi:hypothetical protein
MSALKSFILRHLVPRKEQLTKTRVKWLVNFSY